MDHGLLNKILRATEKLSPEELQMLLNVAQKLKENPGKDLTDDQGLLVKKNDNQDEVLDPDILARKI